MLDLIPTNYYLSENGQMEEFAYYGRMDMEKQILEFKDVFGAHHEFGRATMREVLSRLPDVQKIQLEANCQKTSYFENKGNGEFEQIALPAEVQLAPVYAILTGDFTGDQMSDILLTGNDYGNEVGIGRYDALNGLLLEGDGSGNFKPLSMQRSGIIIPGDGKSLVKLQASNGSLVVVSGQNRGKLGLFRQQNQIPSVNVGPYDHAAIVHLKNNRSYREEIYYGNSFLSQSSRRLWLPGNTEKVELIDYRGSKREVSIPD
jgi:hypothetical protein